MRGEGRGRKRRGGQKKLNITHEYRCQFGKLLISGSCLLPAPPTHFRPLPSSRASHTSPSPHLELVGLLPVHDPEAALPLRVHQQWVAAGPRDHDAVLNRQLVSGQALEGPFADLGVVHQELGDLGGGRRREGGGGLGDQLKGRYVRGDRVGEIRRVSQGRKGGKMRPGPENVIGRMLPSGPTLMPPQRGCARLSPACWA